MIAAGLRPDRLHRALARGASYLISARTTVQAVAAHEASDAIALIVSSSAFDRAFTSLRRGGRLICVARPPVGSGLVPVFELCITGVCITGPFAHAWPDLAGCFELRATGRGRLVPVRSFSGAGG